MQITLPLEEMTKEEKLRVMEELWVDLTKPEEEFSSPTWHKYVLRARKERLESGQEEYKDWEIAKKELRDRLL